MEKLSKQLRELTVRSDIIKLAEDYEAEQEKRVAELEAQLSSSQKRVSDLAHYHHRAIEDAKELADRNRILESELAIEVQLSDSRAKIVADLKPKLAWTPVSAGLPSEPGYYLFEHPDAGLTLYELVNSELYPWRNIAGSRRKSEDMSRLYEQFKRIELPEAP